MTTPSLQDAVERELALRIWGLTRTSPARDALVDALRERRVYRWSLPLAAALAGTRHLDWSSLGLEAPDIERVAEALAEVIAADPLLVEHVVGRPLRVRVAAQTEQ